MLLNNLLCKKQPPEAVAKKNNSTAYSLVVNCISNAKI